jgi:hypothetical protein
VLTSNDGSVRTGKAINFTENHMVARVAEHPGLVLSQAGELTTIEHFTHSVGIIKAIEEGRICGAPSPKLANFGREIAMAGTYLCVRENCDEVHNVEEPMESI